MNSPRTDCLQTELHLYTNLTTFLTLGLFSEFILIHAHTTTVWSSFLIYLCALIRPYFRNFIRLTCMSETEKSRTMRSSSDSQLRFSCVFLYVANEGHEDQNHLLASPPCKLSLLTGLRQKRVFSLQLLALASDRRKQA